jgi:hypothetical protein
MFNAEYSTPVNELALRCASDAVVQRVSVVCR